jgi:hypothetical protein
METTRLNFYTPIPSVGHIYYISSTNNGKLARCCYTHGCVQSMLPTLATRHLSIAVPVPMQISAQWTVAVLVCSPGLSVRVALRHRSQAAAPATPAGSSADSGSRGACTESSLGHREQRTGFYWCNRKSSLGTYPAPPLGAQRRHPSGRMHTQCGLHSA